MYEVLFIDDKVEEIKDVFISLQKENIRCYYSDGVNGIPSGDENLVFKKLQYICLDLHLENRGITTLKDNPTAYSTLASILKKFNPSDKVKIIINSSFSEEFQESELKRYASPLLNNSTFIVEKKVSKFSTLSNCMASIKEQSRKFVLRDIIIRESIDIENLIWDKTKSEIKKNSKVNKKNNFKEFTQNLFFAKKIELYGIFNPSLLGALRKLKDKRNNWAHQDNPDPSNSIDLITFLKEADDLKNKISRT